MIPELARVVALVRLERLHWRLSKNALGTSGLLAERRARFLRQQAREAGKVFEPKILGYGGKKIVLVVF